MPSIEVPPGASINEPHNCPLKAIVGHPATADPSVAKGDLVMTISVGKPGGLDLEEAPDDAAIMAFQAKRPMTLRVILICLSGFYRIEYTE